MKNLKHKVKKRSCEFYSYLDAFLKDYDLIIKYFFKNSILGSFMFRVLYLYIPEFSTNLFRVLYFHIPGSQSLYSRLFTFILQVLYLYIPGSEFCTVF